MKKSMKTILAGLIAVPALVLGIGFAQPVFATAILDGANSAKSEDATNCLFTSDDCENGVFTTITNTALFIIGALSVLMLIYGGIRYTVSGGDSKNVEAAKNTIMYAIIGIVVALLAYAIVNFVLGTLIAA